MALEKKWFILRVQSERESTVSNHLMSRIKAAGLDRYFGRIVVPTTANYVRHEYDTTDEP